MGRQRAVSGEPHGLIRFEIKCTKAEGVAITQAIQDRTAVFKAQEEGPRRFELINAIIESRHYETYLEIGVRDPKDCFDQVRVKSKLSVDPGVECETNLASFKCTSDEFFEGCRRGQWSNAPARWDIIFIDGLHRAEQVWRDIQNALGFISDGGVIILHDCWPPAEGFAREKYEWKLETSVCWNGTTWKALRRYMTDGQFAAFIIDSDWGVGVIDTRLPASRFPPLGANPFYEFDQFQSEIRQSARLVGPEQFLSSLVEQVEDSL